MDGIVQLGGNEVVTDVQTERVNQCLEMYVRCAASGDPNQWKTCLRLSFGRIPISIQHLGVLHSRHYTVMILTWEFLQL